MIECLAVTIFKSDTLHIAISELPTVHAIALACFEVAFALRTVAVVHGAAPKVDYTAFVDGILMAEEFLTGDVIFEELI